MPDLNEMVLPTVWSLARRALANGPAPSLDALIDRLTPVGLIRRSAEGASRSRHVGPSLRVLRQLGVLVEDGDGAVALADPMWDEASFRHAVAVALLAVSETTTLGRYVRAPHGSSTISRSPWRGRNSSD